jgi:hypothetical protein
LLLDAALLPNGLAPCFQYPMTRQVLMRDHGMLLIAVPKDWAVFSFFCVSSYIVLALVCFLAGAVLQQLWDAQDHRLLEHEDGSAPLPQLLSVCATLRS